VSGGCELHVSDVHIVASRDPLEIVLALLEGKGFIKSVEVVGAAISPIGNMPTSSRDGTRIAHLTVLKAAATFGASRPDLKSGDVLKIADAWLAWVEDS